ncbi:hypothetical protein BX666DRAFT_1122241 [Dichotomocladium elegans]|nr:hypothetical protein BX666DRAFT_1122241 [Dichotomocladium elegans]
MSTLWPRPRDSVSPQQTRYYCYACDVEVPIYMAPDPTCQNCNDQFVQEVDADSDPRAFLAGTAEESSTGAREDNNDNSFGLLTLADSERLANELLSINALLHRVMDSVATPPAISDGSSLPQRLHQSPEPSIHHEAFRSHRRMAESNIQFRRMNSDDFSYVRRARRADRGAHREEEGDTAAATGSRDPYLRRFSK